jgi:hypothetical protein
MEVYGMKTMFWLFDRYEHVESAVDRLVEEGFNVEDMNVLLQEEVAKEALDVDLEKVKVEVTQDVGDRTVHGLTRLLGGEQAVEIPGIGDVFASGELATVLAKTAANPGAVNGGLQAALDDFSLPGDFAHNVCTGLEGGKALLFLRTPDERAPMVASLMADQEGPPIASYTHS